MSNIHVDLAVSIVSPLIPRIINGDSVFMLHNIAEIPGRFFLAIKGFSQEELWQPLHFFIEAREFALAIADLPESAVTLTQCGEPIAIATSIENGVLFKGLRNDGRVVEFNITVEEMEILNEKLADCLGVLREVDFDLYQFLKGRLYRKYSPH